VNFVFKRTNRGGTVEYLRLTGGRPGAWEAKALIDDATVFSMTLGDASEKCTVTPFWPFDADDYRSDYPKAFELAAVRVNRVEEV